jgi:uncharacterized membrane protein YbhN (UPF0104 family)
MVGDYSIWEILLSALLIITSITALLLVIILRVKIDLKYVKFKQLKKQFDEILIEFCNKFKDVRLFLKIFVTILINFIRTCLIIYLYFSIFNIKISLPYIMIYYLIIKSCVIINITPGNMGIQEILYGIVSEGIGIGMAQGILVSGTTRIFNYLGLFFIATIFGGIKVIRQIWLTKSVQE